jgi:hypothetical protein
VGRGTFADLACERFTPFGRDHREGLQPCSWRGVPFRSDVRRTPPRGFGMKSAKRGMPLLPAEFLQAAFTFQLSTVDC